MKKIDLTVVEDLKDFIDYERKKVELEIVEIEEIDNNGIRLMLQDDKGLITFKKFYLTSKSIPFFKKFVKDVGLNISSIKNPMQLLGHRFKCSTFLLNKNGLKIATINDIQSLD